MFLIGQVFNAVRSPLVLLHETILWPIVAILMDALASMATKH